MTTKVCSKCMEKKLVELFYTNRGKPRGKCKDCYHPKKACWPRPPCKNCGGLIQSTRSEKTNHCDACYDLYRRCTVLLGSIQHRSIKKQLEYDLDVDWLMALIQAGCPKLGVSFELGDVGKDFGTRSAYAPSVDKIDPLKGYTKDNCQVVSWWYNCAKQQFSDDRMIELCRQVIEQETSNESSV